MYIWTQIVVNEYYVCLKHKNNVYLKKKSLTGRCPLTGRSLVGGVSYLTGAKLPASQWWGSEES